MQINYYVFLDNVVNGLFARDVDIVPSPITSPQLQTALSTEATSTERMWEESLSDSNLAQSHSTVLTSHSPIIIPFPSSTDHVPSSADTWNTPSNANGDVMLNPSASGNKGQFHLIPDMRTPQPSVVMSHTPTSTKATRTTTPLRSFPPTTSANNTPTRDITWVLLSLQSSSDSQVKLEAVKEIKQLAKSSQSAVFWNQYCVQV